jgi:hypothetical protein
LNGVALLPCNSEIPTLLARPGEFVSRYRYALLLLLVGTILDALTTYANVREFGSHVETHPVQRLVFDLFGVTAGVPLAKLVQVGFVMFVAAWWKPWTRWILLICGLLYTAAAISNHFQWL